MNDYQILYVQTLYADDVQLHYCNAILTVAEHDLQQDIQSENSWLCVNLLTLSMLIGSCQKLRNHDLCVRPGQVDTQFNLWSGILENHIWVGDNFFIT